MKVTLAATSRPLAPPTGRGGRGTDPQPRRPCGSSRLPHGRGRHRVPRHEGEQEGDAEVLGGGVLHAGTYKTSPTGGRPTGASTTTSRNNPAVNSASRGGPSRRSSCPRSAATTSRAPATSNKTALPTEALAKLLEREDDDRLADFDGVCFVYAGAQVGSNRGGLYFPHQGALTTRAGVCRTSFCPRGRGEDAAHRPVRPGVRQAARPTQPRAPAPRMQAPRGWAGGA